MSRIDAVAVPRNPALARLVVGSVRGLPDPDRGSDRLARGRLGDASSTRRAYPRRGEPIVPHLLKPLVIERRPVSHGDQDTEMLARLDLGPEAWTRLPAETCRRLSMLVVDRVQTRVRALPGLTRNHPMPHPRIALTLPIEDRTANTIRREMPNAGTGPWTVERYLGLRRFGGRALVDLLAAMEARAGAGVELPETAPVSGVAGDVPSERALDRVLSAIARRLPISEAQASAELVADGLVGEHVDLGSLARTAVQLGRNAPFHIIDVGGSRMLLRLSDVTAARATYRIAARAVQGWGTAPIRAVVAQLRAVVQSSVATSFVERVLLGVSSFRWLDRKEGWFWFDRQRNPLVDSLKKIFSVATRLPLTRLWSALFRTRSGPPPSVEAVKQICSALPGTRVADDVVTIDRPFARAAYLSDTESRIARLLETVPKGMSDAQIRGTMRAAGLPWTPVWRLLRQSPLVERSQDGLYQLVGTVA